MPLWPTRAAAAARAASASAVAAAAPSEPRVRASGELGSEWTPLPSGLSDVTAVSRAEALSVPALARGLDLITTTVAALPLERVAPDGTRVDLGWITQPEARRPRFATLVDTIRDLYLDGVAYWVVESRDADGQPSYGGCRYVPPTAVLVTTDQRTGRQRVHVDGTEVDPSAVIAFHGWHTGIRFHGARVIRTALALDQAAKRLADAPLPNTLLKNVSTYELDEDEIDALIAGVRAARQASAIGYLNSGVDLETLGWNSAELQLVEARQYANASIANLLGLPAHFIAGANPGGSSLTYSNVQQEGRSLIDFGLNPPIKAVESRLSMSDPTGSAWRGQVTPRGTLVRFVLAGLLRGDPLERAKVYEILIPLGVLTLEEARAVEDMAPTGRPSA